MELIDEIIEYLHFNPHSKMADIDAFVDNRVSKATIKRLLSAHVSLGGG